MPQKLIFVYDADANFSSLMSEVAHRTYSPDTYVCNLCKVTYGLVSKKKAWKAYIAALKARGYEVDFAMRKAFRKEHPEHAETALPALLIGDDSGLEALVTGEPFNQVSDVDGMKALVEDALAAHAT